MKTYQTGALAEASCVLIAKALLAYAASDACADDEAEEATALADLFGDPAGNLIELDAEA